MGKRQAKHSKDKKDVDDDDGSTSASSASAMSTDDNNDDEEPPQPISSDDEGETPLAPSQVKALVPRTGHSRFFAPYRTLGILTNGAGFFLIPHDHSGNAMLCCSTGDRFQLVGTDRLQPVLVSQRAPGRGTQEITATISDSSLSISLAVHQAAHRRRGPCALTLFSRTRPLDRVALAASAANWQCAQLLHLGHIKMAMKGEKEGKLENAVLVAAVLRKVLPSETVDEEGVPVVGNDDDDDSDDEDDSHDSSSSSAEDDAALDDDVDDNALGQVVVLVATRSTLTVQRRIVLTNLHPYAAAHPSTYVNKIVVGGENEKGEAAMILLNIRTKKVVHSFRCLPQKTEGRVTSLAQSPAVDTMAVGTEQGAVHLVNLRLDRLLFTVSQKSAVQSISFRTDSSALQYQIAPMAVGTADGSIVVWDLSPSDDDDDDGPSKRNILCEMKDVHLGGIAKLEYLPQEPLLISSGLVSNSIKIHIFDNPDHSGRILRQRAGHAMGPPKLVKYMHPATGGLLANAADGTDAATSCQLLTAGSIDRTVRLFSTARSVLDKEFGQGQGVEKRAKQLGMKSKQDLLLPPVLDMAMSQARTRDWGDLVTIHQQHSLAYVWSTKRGAQSGPVLRQPKWNVSARKPPPPASTHATSVTLSACGNFCMVGTAGGKIYKYNVQSGQPRGCFPPEVDNHGPSGKTAPGNISRTLRQLEKDSRVSNRKANTNQRELDAVELERQEKARRAKLTKASHTRSVTGLAVDAMNKTLISAGSDAKLILWNFSSHAPHRKSPYTLPSPARKLVYVRESDMAAIALDDYAIFLFDCTSLNVVRRLGITGSRARHNGPITDMAFSPDGRSLYTSSLDSTIRLWDVPTSSCTDWMSFESAPTSVSVSPTGEFLATTHSKSLGISLWSDRSFYQTIHTDGKHIDRPFQMDEPLPLAESWETETKAAEPSETYHAKGQANEEEKSRGPVKSKEPGLITLSGLPAAHWKNLFHLELVKERNKPKEPPKKPPSAPFFLQWRIGEEVAGQQKDDDPKAIESASNEKEELWASAWTDDNDGDTLGTEVIGTSKREADSNKIDLPQKKRTKISRYRSELATILEERPGNSETSSYQGATEYVARLGPSAIDVELSSLCAGMHDLEEGLPLLCKACDWLLECVQSRERFEAVNAYLHRFLHLHGSVIAGVKDDSFELGPSETDEGVVKLIEQSRSDLLEKVARLKKAQNDADEMLRDKMQQSLCLLRHLTRMV